MAFEVRDLGLREHPPITDQDHLLEAEAVAKLLDLRRNRARITAIAWIHLEHDRTPLDIGQHAVDDDRFAALTVAVVTTLHQGTGMSLVVAAGHVVEHLRSLAQVARREFFLNARLALDQPIHRPIQLILVGITQCQLLGQGGGVP